MTKEDAEAIQRTIDACRSYGGFVDLQNHLTAILEGRETIPKLDPNWRLKNADVDPKRNAFIEKVLMRRKQRLGG